LAKKPKDIQAMVDLLRQGAALTELACPACASPLFKLRSGDLWCAKCQKRVIVVKEGEQPTEATSPMLLNTLESTILSKMQEIDERLKTEKDPDQLQKLGATLSTLLEDLEKIRKMKTT
jgi:UPF0148 protein